MLSLMRNFRADEDGAVTVDWVVITACMVGLGISVLVIVRTGTVALHGGLETQLTSTTLPASPFGASGSGSGGNGSGGTGTTPTTPTTGGGGGGGGGGGSDKK